MHSCHSADLGELLPKECRCRKYVGDAKLKELLGYGEIIEIVGHSGEQTFAYTRIRAKTPRSPSIEASHMQRSVLGVTAQKAEGITEEQIKRLQQLREQAAREFQQEAAARIKIFHEIELEERAKLIVPFRPDPWIGRCIFASGIGDDSRSSVGVDRSPRDAFVPSEFDVEDQTNFDVDQGEIEPDENTKTIGLYQEAEEAEYEYAAD